MSESRYIPKDVSDAVKKGDHFECAWCGTKILERHHIVEWSDGGEHTLENLILLCSNCHTQVHKGEIDIDELVKRKSTHIKGDRISGSAQFNLVDSKFRLGDAYITNTPVLLAFRDNPVLGYKIENEELLIFASFYNKNGELIFWMSSNRYWATSDFTVTCSREEMTIKNENDLNNQLRIWKENDVLNITGVNYFDGLPIMFTPDYIFNSRSMNSYKGQRFDKCGLGAINIG